MANFRAERLFIRINGYADGFDPNKGIDPTLLATVMHNETSRHVDRSRIADFAAPPFDRARWFSASKGLNAIRLSMADVQAELESCTDESTRLQLDQQLQTLRAVEDCLDTIDSRDLKFYFLMRDLG